MEVKYVSSTPEGEATIAYCARVSSSNQDNPEYAKLLSYCMREGHWSVFEQADLTLEITTSRAIAAQLLRHKSFCFQEFSQRYQEAKPLFEITEARAQDLTNRQASHDTLPKATKDWFGSVQEHLYAYSYALYQEALSKGIAKECARFLLPLSIQSKLYMKGSVRSWIHYFKVRMDKSTQKEHRDVAEEAFAIFSEHYPTIATLIKENDI